MTWLKAGDTAATHPIVLRAGGDDRQINELFGFVMRCWLHSAAHLTDYFIDDAVTWMFGGRHTERLVKAARKAGYWAPHKLDGHKGWLLVEDPEFIHIRLKAEVEWEKTQRKDSANPALTVPVRQRDGDGCRYCRSIVNWSARKGNRAGTYDHRIPGKAGTVDTVVVACLACNAGRRDRPDADERYPLLDVPLDPFYGPRTVAFLASHSVTVPLSTPARPDIQSAPASTTTGATPQPAGTREQDQARPDIQSAPANVIPLNPGSADRLPPESGLAGTGRDGSGSSTTSVPEPAPRPGRARRGRPR